MNRSITIIRESRVGVPGLMLESMNFGQLYEAVENDEGAKKGFMKKLWEKFRDSSLVDLGLDLLGILAGVVTGVATGATGGAGAPTLIIGMIPDLLNAIRRFARGDKFQGALSLICAIPFAGDAIQTLVGAERALSGGAKAAMTVVNAVSKWASTNRATAKKVQTSTAAIAGVLAEHVPDMKEHHDDMVSAVESLTSGDKEKVIALAKESGMRIAAREAGMDPDKVAPRSKPTRDSDEKSTMAERRHRGSYRLVDLYEGTLYEKRARRA